MSKERGAAGAAHVLGDGRVAVVSWGWMSMRFCGSCGAAVKGMRFCGSCGQPVAAWPPALAASAGDAKASRAAPVAHPEPPAMTRPTELTDVPARWHEAKDIPPTAPVMRPRRGSGGRNRRIGWIAVVAAAVLIVGGTTSYYLLHLSKTGGAVSPEAAVTELAAALEQRDLVGAALLLPPGEFQSIQGAFSALGEAAARADFAEGSPDLPSVLSGTDLSIDGLTVSAKSISVDLVKVELTGGIVTFSIDPAGATGLTREMLQSATVDWSTQGRFSVDIGHVADYLGYRPFVMVVQRDRVWYVSPLFTAGEYLSVSRGTVRAPASPGDGHAQQYPTPEAAADAFVRRLADAINRHDASILAEGLPADEAAAVLTYRRALDDVLGNSSLSISVLNTSFTAEGHDPGLRVVRPTLISLQASTGLASARIDVQGSCVIVNNAGQQCLTDIDALGHFDLESWRPLLANLDTGLVAVRSGDGWRISPLTTVLTQATRLVQGWTPPAMLLTIADIFKSEIAARALFSTPSVGSVGADGSVDVAFNGQPFVVVDATFAGDMKGYSYTSSGQCSATWWLSPSGAVSLGSGDSLVKGVYRAVLIPTVYPAEGVSHCKLWLADE